MIDLNHIDFQQFEASAGKAAALLKTLSNERRLMILCQLGDRELQVGALLREEGLVATRREGQSIFYHIADPAVVRVIATLAVIFNPPSPE